MAITHDTLKLGDELRVLIRRKVNRTVRQLVLAWAKAWDEIEGEFKAAITELLAAEGDGIVTLAQLARADRAQKALLHALEQLDGLTEFSGVLIVHTSGATVEAALDYQERLARSQLPPGAASTAITWNRISRDAIDAMVERITQRIHSTLLPLGPDAVNAMHRELLRAVVVGENPRQAAAEMLRRVEGRFNGGLTRALTIARTEILDAYRSGAAASHFANADVLQGWVWLAQLDSRTCPSCWAMHGSQHEVTDLGPNDHQNGRCARMPVTKSWRDLGFDLDEPASVVPDAQDAFWAMSRADQLAVMGPTRLAALESGADWRLLSEIRSTPGWRDSHVTAPAWTFDPHGTKPGRPNLHLV